MDLSVFQDVKFLLMGGSASKMKNGIECASKELEDSSHRIPLGLGFKPLGKNERHSLYKLGSLICVNHGMGAPSLSILMHELIKLLSYAKATEVTIIRLGTCGGLGVTPGSVVVSSGALNSALKPVYTKHVLGRALNRPTTVNSELAASILKCNADESRFQIASGLTMSCDDFYEEQGRLDGYFCDHTDQERVDHIEHCYKLEVRQHEGSGGVRSPFGSFAG